MNPMQSRKHLETEGAGFINFCKLTDSHCRYSSSEEEEDSEADYTGEADSDDEGITTNTHHFDFIVRLGYITLENGWDILCGVVPLC